MELPRWMIFKTLLDQVGQEINKVAREHGWWEPRKQNGVYVQRNFPEILMLITSEAAEALEEWRNHHDYNEIYFSCEHGKYTNPNDDCATDPHCHDRKPEGIPVEMADIIIRTLDSCQFYGIDVSTALEEKINYNKTRPYRHGGKRA